MILEQGHFSDSAIASIILPYNPDVVCSRFEMDKHWQDANNPLEYAR